MKISEFIIKKEILGKILEYFNLLSRDPSGVEIFIQLEDNINFIYCDEGGSFYILLEIMKDNLKDYVLKPKKIISMYVKSLYNIIKKIKTKDLKVEIFDDEIKIEVFKKHEIPKSDKKINTNYILNFRFFNNVDKAIDTLQFFKEFKTDFSFDIPYNLFKDIIEKLASFSKFFKLNIIKDYLIFSSKETVTGEIKIKMDKTIEKFKEKQLIYLNYGLKSLLKNEKNQIITISIGTNDAMLLKFSENNINYSILKPAIIDENEMDYIGKEEDQEEGKEEEEEEGEEEEEEEEE